MTKVSARATDSGAISDAGLLHSIAGQLTEAVVSVDAQGAITRWNAAAEALFGYDGSETLGRPLYDVLPPGDKVESLQALSHLSRNEPIREWRVTRIGKTGISLELLMSVEPLLSGMRAVGAVYIFKPVNFRSAGLRAAADTIADFVWTADAQGRGVFISSKFERYIGPHPHFDAHRMWFSAVVHPDDRALTCDAWAFALRTAQKFEVEARLRRGDGAFRWFVIRGNPLVSEDGRIAEWTGTCTDIDDLKRSEQALRRSNDELKQFAYAAAHDFQEPLRNISVSVGMVKRHCGQEIGANAQPWIDASMEGARRLHAMVNDLLAFTTVLDIRQPGEGQPRTSLTEALGKTLSAMMPQIKAATATVLCSELPDAHVIEGHAILLFQNLIANALKFRDSRRRPRVQIQAEQAENCVNITIRDNGIGFDPAYATQIFGLFKRLHTREEYPGSGIGLALCDRIVSHYGGRIWAESVPGEGATFRFTLPGIL